MLNLILTGQVPPFTLLVWGVALFIFFLPSVLAFQKGHRRFWWILALNLVIAPLQQAILVSLFPDFFAVAGATPGELVWKGLIANLGAGWLALLAWSLAPVAGPDPRLIAARNTKLYDLAAGLPLALWFAYGVVRLRPSIVANIEIIAAGAGTLFTWAQLFSLAGSALFNLLLVWLLLVRDKPVLKARGAVPRIAAFAGTFLGVAILQLPVAPLSAPVQVAAALLVGTGSVLAAIVLSRLGKSFSIMPEARRLVTDGPYALVRHPLYAVELLIIAGMALQFSQPLAGILGVAVVVLLVIRALFEERVLAEAYPEYEAYRARVKRFIPGVI
ncbi:MAG TPA: isoprenylcysteine carboxylmethyltransferase family protein [Rhizomicrobium sp.]|nr:isoprenylcysteine carboxylmethyltransferase family protein [Rhizomicrobium sp.]